MNSRLKELETESPVDANLNYSNLGYVLLGQVIEQVSGISYEQYLKEHVLNPLGMFDTYVDKQDSQERNERAVAYTAINRNGARKRANSFQTRAMTPAAGLFSSIPDLAKYASWQFRLMSASVREVLHPSTLKKMYDVHAESKNGLRTWGLGFETYDDESGNKWVSHGGICPGYVSFLKMDLTNKMAYAVMVNANGVSALQLLNGMKAIMEKVETTSKNDIGNRELEEFTGYYNLNPWNSEYYVSTWGQGLVLMYLPAKKPVDAMYFYKQTGQDTFRLMDDNSELSEEIVFERDENGKVYRILNEGNYHPKIQRE